MGLLDMFAKMSSVGEVFKGIDLQVRSFSSPRTWFAQAQARSRVTAPFTVESVRRQRPYLTRRVGENN